MANWQQEEVDILNNYINSTSTEVSSRLRECGFYRSPSAVRNFKKKIVDSLNNSTYQDKQPLIGILDIETLPLKVYSWGIWKQNISESMIIEDWCILSWAGKILNEDKIYGDILNPEEVKERKDLRLLNQLWNFLNACDIIIAHNGDKFDVRKINARMILNKLDPPSPYKTIDTLKHSRFNFGFTTHKLDYIGKLLIRQQKLKTNIELWRRCDNGEQEYLDYMFEYNKKDTILLEKVFLEMRGWMKNVPNIAVISESEDTVCTHCGSANLEENGFYTTLVNKFKTYRCKDCGAISRERKSILTKDQRNNLLVPVIK